MKIKFTKNRLYIKFQVKEIIAIFIYLAIVGVITAFFLAPFQFANGDNNLNINKQLQNINEVKLNIKKIKDEINKTNLKLKTLNNKLIEEQQKYKKMIEDILQKIKDEKKKKILFNNLLGFVPNKYLLTHKYYYSPNIKTIILPEQIMLNWHVNHNGASKPYIYLKGKNSDERFKYLLSLYGLKNTYKYWVDTQNKFKIKKELLICIARADSDLGKQLKSKNNIGNVGNNDRGDTVNFSSIKKGIEAIGKVLNNRYLARYTIVGELSEGGRRQLGLPSCKINGVYCYATSRENWNVNVLNCLSMIYNKPITEKFKFRLEN